MLNLLYGYISTSQGVATMNYFKDMTDDGIVKFLACIGSGILSWLASSFAPLWTILFLLFLCTVTDAFLGVKVSLANGYKCESRKLWKTLRKFGWCGAIIWFAHQVDTEILTSFNAHLVELFAGAISGVELWSIIENLSELYPDGPWKILNKFIKSKGEKYLDITIEKEDLPKVKELVKKIK
jgi:hypothetical protein